MHRLSIITLRNAQFLRKILTSDHENVNLQQIATNLFPIRHITSNNHVEDEKTLTETEYLVKIKNDPDTFGASTAPKQTDEDDVKEQLFLENKPSETQRLRTKQYADIIKDLIRKKKIKEAIDVLEVRMIKEDRVKPENYIFNLVLGACGRVGYTKKAFSLYNKMKQRDLAVTGGTYTALFNACANSPWAEDGLTRARHLREIMVEKRYEANDTNYNAMIKAFGRCGDLATAFSLVDEMADKKLQIKDDTLNFLLQACITDKEAGFRHSLLVWRQFVRRNVTPSIYSFNLLLKTIKECGLGDADVTDDVVKQILQEDVKLLENRNVKQIQSNRTDDDVKNDLTSTTNEFLNSTKLPSPTEENRPNLLARRPHLGTILGLSEVKRPEDRLLLVGGLSGFLKNMFENHCTPDIKTFTQLLDCIPGTTAAEKELIIAMKKFNVKADVDFYNMLIKKRSMRCDYNMAKEVLDMMRRSKLRPNLITYGVLALGCATKQEAESLMEEMKESKYRMNAEILGAMLHQGCHHFNFGYVLEIMEMCVREEVRPNQVFMERLETFKKTCKKISNNKENGLAKTASFQRGFEIFKLRYKTWKDEVDPIRNDEVHPWQQFRQNTDSDVKHYKDKEASSRFKPRHSSLFKQKTSLVRDKSEGKKFNNQRHKQDVW